MNLNQIFNDNNFSFIFYLMYIFKKFTINFFNSSAAQALIGQNKEKNVKFFIHFYFRFSLIRRMYAEEKYIKDSKCDQWKKEAVN